MNVSDLYRASLTPEAQQTILIKCVDDLHHIPCYERCADQATGIVGCFPAGVGHDLRVSPKGSVRIVCKVAQRYRVLVSCELSVGRAVVT